MIRESILEVFRVNYLEYLLRILQDCNGLHHEFCTMYCTKSKVGVFYRIVTENTVDQGSLYVDRRVQSKYTLREDLLCPISMRTWRLVVTCLWIQYQSLPALRIFDDFLSLLLCFLESHLLIRHY